MPQELQWMQRGFGVGMEMCGASQVAQMVKNVTANVGDIRDTSSIPGLGKYPGWGHDDPLQYSCLENPTHRAWWATVHGVTKSPTRSHLARTHGDMQVFNRRGRQRPDPERPICCPWQDCHVVCRNGIWRQTTCSQFQALLLRDLRLWIIYLIALWLIFLIYNWR